MQYLSKIINSHSCGRDNISSSTLKCIAHEICECLILFNFIYFIYNQIPPQSEENNILHKRTEIKY